jgi:arylamine N-acetyltransferase
MDSAYTPSQVAEYLSYIGLPQSYHPSSKPILNLDYLTTLFTHQLTAVPYDNLSIHYSPSHTIALDPQSIFSKIVSARRGRGGYCMENSILFNHMLRAIGFPAYLAGVRIRPRVDGVPQGESYTGWVHLVNIVTIPDASDSDSDDHPGVKYAVDVGFGGDGMTVPMPLVEGKVHHNSIGTQEIRFVREFIPNQRFRGEGAHPMWVYQVRNGREKEWVSFFAFHDQFEFTEEDFGNINWYTSQSPESHQTWTPLAIRFLRGVGEDGRARVVGKVMMVKGVIKRNVTGKTELVKVCTTEKERVEALRELFGIQLTEEEVVSIRGRQAELVEDTA